MGGKQPISGLVKVVPTDNPRRFFVGSVADDTCSVLVFLRAPLPPPILASLRFSI